MASIEEIKIDILQEALREAILQTIRVTRHCTQYDPAGSTYEIDWTAEVKKWAKLCDLDLDQWNPCAYDRSC